MSVASFTTVVLTPEVSIGRQNSWIDDPKDSGPHADAHIAECGVASQTPPIDASLSLPLAVP